MRQQLLNNCLSGFLVIAASIFGTATAQASYDGYCRTQQDVQDLPAGHWCEVEGSHLRDVAPCGGGLGATCGFKTDDPQQACYDSYAVYDFGHIIGGWNSGAYDTNRERLIIFGGGHRGWAGNDIYGFSLDTLEWERLRDADCIRPEDLRDQSPYNLENSGYYLNPTGSSTPDNVNLQSPRSRHTYNYLQYVPATDLFCSFGGNGFSYSGQGTGSSAVDCFNFTTKRWEKKTDTPVWKYAFTAYDPVKERIWTKGFDWPAAGLAEYDPINDTWTQRETGISSGYGHTGDIDPNRRLLVAAGEGSVWQWQIDLPGALAREVVETSGGASIVDSYAPGFVYDPVAKKFVAWNGGTDVYLLDIDARVWTRHPPASNLVPADHPGLRAVGGGINNGTYGRFRYSPNKNLFIVVNSVDQNVFLYRLNPGGGVAPDTTAPAAPSNLEVR